MDKLQAGDRYRRRRCESSARQPRPVHRAVEEHETGPGGTPTSAKDVTAQITLARIRSRPRRPGRGGRAGRRLPWTSTSPTSAALRPTDASLAVVGQAHQWPGWVDVRRRRARSPSMARWPDCTSLLFESGYEFMKNAVIPTARPVCCEGRRLQAVDART